MKKYLILILITTLSNSLFAQDSCYLNAVILSNKMELNCKEKITTLNAETSITLSKLSIALEINIMGYLKHNYFVIKKLDSCKKTETGFEYTYHIEESAEGNDAITRGKSILKISKNNNFYTFDILGIKKEDCSTKFFVTSYNKTK